MNKTCCIISAGDVNLSLLEKKKNGYDFFIAADAGYEKAKEAGIVPGLIVGDFDSLSQECSDALLHALKKGNSDIIKFPIEKDYSDTHLAIEEGIKSGYTDFDVYGALGGDRFSHSLANIQTLCTMKQRNISVRLIGMKETLYLLENETLSLTLPKQSSFSVFALSDECQKVTINGGKYALKDAVLTNTFPLGVSNESLSETVSISVKKGYLLVILEH